MREDFTVMTGTLIERGHTALHRWLLALHSGELERSAHRNSSCHNFVGYGTWRPPVIRLFCQQECK